MSLVLVVDDEVAMRELIKRFLLAHGHLTVEAPTAEDALEHLASTPGIQVVVADLQMPGNGGAWLVEQMTRRFPKVSVVLATADETVPGSLSLQSSVVGYVVKPIDGAQLAVAVAQGVVRYEAQTSTSRDRDSPADPIESWLDKKLTRGPRDGGSSRN